ncbi:hypothetical protein F5148DRAFT_702033 [Russula earlei]|uniref:Uncharacterized protein n=1 Tax=Russula earlei TaxID=71964 RepID=A0ACC0UFD9_9AGAM|nr:hypothetical protein F5148DRAFT_702033 [Russula earlei]
MGHLITLATWVTWSASSRASSSPKRAGPPCASGPSSRYRATAVWTIFSRVRGRLTFDFVARACRRGLLNVDCFCAGDTVLHSWEVLASILSSDKAQDILCDIGMCVALLLPPPSSLCSI